MTLLLPHIEDQSFIRTFMDRVQRLGPDDCWPWQGATSSGNGRGAMIHNNTFINPSRLSWVLRHREEVPQGLFVCHTCDNSLCMNPDHLWLGTNTDNVLDASDKGRMIGVSMERHHVLDGQARRIRASYASGHYTQKAIADHYGVTRQAINKICCGRRRASE